MLKVFFSESQCYKIKDVFNSFGHLLDDDKHANLVHGDFDPANILVSHIGGRLKIMGILDWEFAYSSSTIGDVSKMLRYAYHMPDYYESSFIDGLMSGGYKLPEDWKRRVHIVNILSLLDCLKRSDPKIRPKQTKDIKEVVTYILEQF